MKVTVYVPTKNRRLLLARAISSVLAQTYQDIELIVVDDASTDDTARYLLELEERGAIRAIISRKAYGACSARNMAIEAAKGEFVTGLDDDDYFLPHRIRSFVQAWSRYCAKQDNKIAGLFDEIIHKGVVPEKRVHTTKVVRASDLRTGNIVGNQVFAPKSHFITAGSFDPEMPAWQDWDLWLRMANKLGSFLNISTGSYVVDDATAAEASISSRPETAIRSAGELFGRKHQMLSLADRSAIAANLLNYPQVTPSTQDIACLLLAGKLKAGGHAGLKKTRLLPYAQIVKRRFFREDP